MIVAGVLPVEQTLPTGLTDSATLAEAVALAVADGVSEACRPGVISGRHKINRLRARVVGDRAVCSDCSPP